MSQISQTLERDGFIWFRQALSEKALLKLEAKCELGRRPGARPQWDASFDALLGPESEMQALTEAVLPGARPVRLVAFNKSQDSNWAVPWHQDRVIAVKEKADVAGFSNWARRDNYWHVEPPATLLQDMVFARIHFDHAFEENGALEIAAGSHRLALVSAAEADECAGHFPTALCEAERGDLVFVKSLTLHRSRPSRSEHLRRALRVDFCAQTLPKPLRWAFGA